MDRTVRRGRGRDSKGNARRVAVALLCALAAPLGAQSAECDQQVVLAQEARAVAQLGERARWHPLRHRLAPEPLGGHATATSFYVAALDSVRLALLADPAAPADARRDSLAVHLQRASRELEARRDDPGTRRRGDVADTRFKPIFQAGGFILGGTGVRVTSGDSPAARQALCWPAIRASAILGRWSAESYAQAAAALRVIDGEWRAFEEKGLSEYPWERALFDALTLGALRGRCRPDGWRPPSCQFVVLHPNVGYAVDAAGGGRSGLSRLRSESTVALELLGVVRYRDDWRGYRGASVIALLTDRPVGVGAAVHVASGLQAGLAVRENDAGRWRRVAGYLSVDAYGLLDVLPARLAGLRERVRAEEAAAVERP